MTGVTTSVEMTGAAIAVGMRSVTTEIGMTGAGIAVGMRSVTIAIGMTGVILSGSEGSLPACIMDRPILTCVDAVHAGHAAAVVDLVLLDVDA